jgi:hypothetical protein
MNAADFRRIALGLSDAVEAAHMGHPDFRVNGRIFATIHPDHEYGMVRLTPDQQQHFMTEHPSVFAPENGAWGRQGCTRVRLGAVDEDLLGEAMTLAWQNTATRRATKRAKTGRRPRGRRRSHRRPD